MKISQNKYSLLKCKSYPWDKLKEFEEDTDNNCKEIAKDWHKKLKDKVNDCECWDVSGNKAHFCEDMNKPLPWCNTRKQCKDNNDGLGGAENAKKSIYTNKWWRNCKYSEIQKQEAQIKNKKYVKRPPIEITNCTCKDKLYNTSLDDYRRADENTCGKWGKEWEQKEKDLIAAQEDYVETFDRGRSHCLNLFEHIHGESRDRGQAMINLSETYLTKGLHIDSGELPDYLPLFMEYLSLCDPKDAIELLGEAIDVIALIGTKLKKNKSPYAGIFECIEVLSVTKADSKKIKNAIRESRKDPETLEELDEQWKEADAFTGDPFVDVETDCNKCNAFPNTTEVLNNMAGDKK